MLAAVSEAVPVIGLLISELPLTVMLVNWSPKYDVSGLMVMLPLAFVAVAVIVLPRNVGTTWVLSRRAWQSVEYLLSEAVY